ncbi:uncharacterized protein [Tiliqua scincoides]|uniref:uncharacterized protein n=1 Tax=Tiliqua scincoides TaxID=71010 RepID=UPI003462C64C
MNEPGGSCSEPRTSPCQKQGDNLAGRRGWQVTAGQSTAREAGKASPHRGGWAEPTACHECPACHPLHARTKAPGCTNTHSPAQQHRPFVVHCAQPERSLNSACTLLAPGPRARSAASPPTSPAIWGMESAPVIQHGCSRMPPPRSRFLSLRKEQRRRRRLSAVATARALLTQSSPLLLLVLLEPRQPTPFCLSSSSSSRTRLATLSPGNSSCGHRIPFFTGLQDLPGLICM